MSACFSFEDQCPVCGGHKKEYIYPIDKLFAINISGIASIESDLGVVRCLACGHQYIYPTPTERFLVEFYSNYMSVAKKGFYTSKDARVIPDSYREYYSPWLTVVLGMVRLPNPRLMDVGCGLGMFLRLAREYGFEVRGVEPNSEAVKRLAKVFSIEAYNMLLEDYSANETFDVVTMWDILEHLSQPRAALEKVHSILTPNGLLVLEIPIRDSLLHWMAKALYRLSFGQVKRPLFLTYGVHHLQYFTEKSITSFLTDHGFDVVKSKRTETSLDALRKRKGGIKAQLYNFSLNVLFWLARLLKKQNKFVVIAKKCTES